MNEEKEDVWKDYPPLPDPLELVPIYEPPPTARTTFADDKALWP